MKAIARKPAEDSNASHAVSTLAVDLESKAREASLDSFISEVKDRFEKRFTGIPYDSPQYDFRQHSGQTDSKGDCGFQRSRTVISA